MFAKQAQLDPHLPQAWCQQRLAFISLLASSFLHPPPNLIESSTPSSLYIARLRLQALPSLLPKHALALIFVKSFLPDNLSARDFRPDLILPTTNLIIILFPVKSGL
jgi:hypothetical protein